MFGLRGSEEKAGEGFKGMEKSLVWVFDLGGIWRYDSLLFFYFSTFGGIGRDFTIKPSDLKGKGDYKG